MKRQPTYSELLKLVNKPYNGTWHAIFGGVYQIYDTYDEAKAEAKKDKGLVISGDLHDLMMGIEN
jgi:hypothetical protein